MTYISLLVGVAEKDTLTEGICWPGFLALKSVQELAKNEAKCVATLDEQLDSLVPSQAPLSRPASPVGSVQTGPGGGQLDTLDNGATTLGPQRTLEPEDEPPQRRKSGLQQRRRGRRKRGPSDGSSISSSTKPYSGCPNCHGSISAFEYNRA
eukprot:maker-scaffold7741_size3031-snap-gene-0.0 protein:Tk11889 transcript:maker-scaffold7741_size3031-snap-gene-0.0-mRNA-1 annotation:"transposon en spm sub-class"